MSKDIDQKNFYEEESNDEEDSNDEPYFEWRMMIGIMLAMLFHGVTTRGLMIM